MCAAVNKYRCFVMLCYVQYPRIMLAAVSDSDSLRAIAYAHCLGYRVITDLRGEVQLRLKHHFKSIC